ncbi:MAG: hypothetical protein JXX28_16565 [Deltaproteobacteria bacterium]|nr:hypothetical protein [Deltaproteobacteria bacterium]
MKNPLALLLILAALTLQAGCAAAVRYHAPSLDHLPSSTTSTQRSLGFLWGLIPPSPISLEQCGEPGIQKMKVKQGLIDSIITIGTGGIVVSYKVKITCASAATTR